MDSLQGIARSANGMRRNMGSCHCLPCSTGSRASGIVFPHFTSSSMSCKRSPADVCHLEHARTHPLSTRFESVAGATVLWESSLEVRQYTLDAIGCPDGQSRMVSLPHKL